MKSLGLNAAALTRFFEHARMRREAFRADDEISFLRAALNQQAIRLGVCDLLDEKWPTQHSFHS